MATLRQLLAGNPAGKVGAEVELGTTTYPPRKRCKVAACSKSKKDAGKCKGKASGGSSLKKRGGKAKSAKQPMFKQEERVKIASVNSGQLRDYVMEKVRADLFVECFPERAVVWEHICIQGKLHTVICNSSEKYLELYSRNSASCRDKNSALFLAWLDYVRTWTCDEERIRTFVGVNVQVSSAASQTVFAIVLNAIYLGICLQMAKTAEQISTNKHVSSDTHKASDEVAMHRICEWALKSLCDHLKTKNRKNSISYSSQLDFVTMLKLPNEEKHLLPQAVQYLDRGGLTFLRQELWHWMMLTEEKLIRHLNQTAYQRYGSKLFEASHNLITLDQEIQHVFETAVTEFQGDLSHEDMSSLHQLLLHKIYNARCNEFLRATTKLACLDKGKGIDGNVSLRDELKVRALKKIS